MQLHSVFEMSPLLCTGELYMILDDDLWLLVTPDRFKLNRGTVMCAAPIYQVEVLRLQ
jgi:hypothetical protein